MMVAMLVVFEVFGEFGEFEVRVGYLFLLKEPVMVQ